MTRDERALLLFLARWCLQLEGGTAEQMGEQNHPGLKRLRELIEAVSKDIGPGDAEPSPEAS